MPDPFQMEMAGCITREPQIPTADHIELYSYRAERRGFGDVDVSAHRSPR